MSTADIKDFIGVFDNVVPDTVCNEIIDAYEFLVANGYGVTRRDHDGVSKLLKDNTAVFVSVPHICNFMEFKHNPTINNILWNTCYKSYAEKYNILADGTPKGNFIAKVQKNEIGQGYHVWHYEASDRLTSNRLLLYIIYLNDVDEGGETEFLYYPRRVKPKKGTVLLLPCGFSHTHRGNPPISNSKYIVTGWIEY